MAWTTPRTSVTGEIHTAAMLNETRDNLTFLGGSKGAAINTAEGTTSGTFTDLATAGPAVTVLTGAKAFVHVSAQINAVGTGQGYMAFAISGATTVAASFNKCLQYGAASGGYVVQLGATFYVDSLTPGNNVFTAKYATGVVGVTFGLRNIAVQPLP